MRLLGFVARCWVALAWCAMWVVAALLTLAFAPFLRPLAYGERRRGIAPRSALGDELRDVGLAPASEPITDADPGDETDLLQPHRLYCMACGHGATVASCSSALPPCPDCGGQRWSTRPDLPILGEPKEWRP